MRHTVRFADGVAEIAEPGRIFLEVGPGTTLTTFARENIRGMTTCASFASLPHPKDPQTEPAFILQTLGKLWMAGVEVNWNHVHKGERLHRVPLPTYPFERQRYWAGAEAAGEEVREAGPPEKKADLADWFYAPSWTRSVAPSALASGEKLGPWLVFLDAGGFGAYATQQLSARRERFTTVTAGKSFAQLSERSYTIDPARAEDYLRLLHQALNQAGTEANLWPRSVLFLWGLDGGREAFHCLLRLSQAFGDSGRRDPVDSVIVSAEMHSVTGRETVDPEQALMAGPCKVMPCEYPFIRCRGVDICRADWSPALWSLSFCESLACPCRPEQWRIATAGDGSRRLSLSACPPSPLGRASRAST